MQTFWPGPILCVGRSGKLLVRFRRTTASKHRFLVKTSEIYSQTVREEFYLGPASSVQKTLQSLDARDILDSYRGEYFFLDPLLPCWIRSKAAKPSTPFGVTPEGITAPASLGLIEGEDRPSSAGWVRLVICCVRRSGRQLVRFQRLAASEHHWLQ